MRKLTPERWKKVLPAGLFLLLTLVVMYLLNYIDGKVLFQLYLPILVVGFLAMFFSWIHFTTFFFVLAGIGLWVEYLYSLKRTLGPSMTGAFINIFLLALGLVGGIVLEVLLKKKKDRP